MKFQFYSIGLTLGFFLIGLAGTPPAQAKLCNPAKERCWLNKGNSTSSPAYPSKNSSININPSAVPVDDGFGIEALTYDGEWDFALVKGTGRIGAAISPTNGEEAFFGPPGLELNGEYLERKIEREKYESQKINLATAFNIYKNKKSGMRQFILTLGVIGKYNTVSEDIHPGGGVGMILGPLTLGYSLSQDKYVLEKDVYQLSEDIPVPYEIETVSVGIFLNSLALDYSELKMTYEDNELSRVSLITASLLLKRVILTASRRREDSYRPAYNFKTKSLEQQQFKYEYFGGVQVGVTKTIMLGAFYNYYLLREISFGLTWFI